MERLTKAPSACQTGLLHKDSRFAYSHFSYSRFAYDLSRFAYSHFAYSRFAYSKKIHFFPFRLLIIPDKEIRNRIFVFIWDIIDY